MVTMSFKQCVHKNKANYTVRQKNCAHIIFAITDKLHNIFIIFGTQILQ